MDNQTYERRPEKRRSKKGIFIAVLLLGVYVFLQMYLVNANGVDTIKASEGYINDSVITQGIICREEVVLTQNSGGVVDYLVDDGERVSKGGLVARVYPSYSDIEKIIYLRNRQQTLDDINTATGYIDGNALDISQTRKQLTKQMSGLSYISSTHDFNAALDQLTDITLSLNKISVATGRADSFSGAKSIVQDEINTVQSGIMQPLSSLYTPHTGYFIKSVDGYESVATVDNIVTWSYDKGMELINGYTEYGRDSVRYGKMITNYKWSIGIYVDDSVAEKLSVGKTLSLSLNINRNSFNKATIEQIVDLGDKNLIIMECTVMDRTSASARVSDCEILFRQYTGIKIPKTAIHFVDGEMGVYVNFSNVVYFKKITPTYEDDNYVIVPKQTNENNQVEMYDSIIVKGRNLYHGKYL